MSIKSFYHFIKSILSRLYSMSYIIYLIFYILYFMSYILCLVFYVLYLVYIFLWTQFTFFSYTLHKYIIRYYKLSISNNNKSKCQGQKLTTLINMDCSDLRAHTSTLCFYSCKTCTTGTYPHPLQNIRYQISATKYLHIVRLSFNFYAHIRACHNIFTLHL